MVYDRQSTYVTWGGRIGTSTSSRELWQCGLHLALSPSLDGPGLPTVAELNTLLAEVIRPMHSSVNVQLSEGARLSWAKATSLDPSGHATADPVVSTVVDGGGSSAVSSAASPQEALCVTLWSGSNLGRANYGRIYLPWWNQAVDRATGRVAVEEPLITTLATFFGAFDDWAASALSATARVRIMSKAGAGTTKTPAAFRVGDVKDTQRRRRNAIREQYTQNAWPT